MVSPIEIMNNSRGGGVSFIPPQGYAPARQRQPSNRASESSRQLANRMLANRGALASVGRGAQAEQSGNAMGPLGYVVGAPWKVLKTGINVLDRGRRASVLGQEAAANILPDYLEWLSPPSMLVDENREEDRSALERFQDAEYGWGQVAKQIDTGHGEVDKWLNRGQGLAGDILLDPLTYATFGVESVLGKSGRAAELVKLLDAQRLTKPAELARLGEATSLATKETELLRGLGFGDEALGTLPISSEFLDESAENAARLAEANDLMKRIGGAEGAATLGGAEDLNRLGKIGTSAANPAQLEAMGLRQHGVRWAGRKIPGSEGVSRALSIPAQKMRPILRGLPGAEALRAGASRTGRVDQELHNAYERVINGKGGMTVERALDYLDLNTQQRLVGGTFEGLANRQLRILKDKTKDFDSATIDEMVRRAELGIEDNAFSQYAAAIRQAAKMAGGTIPEFKNGIYVMPHVLSRDFRNWMTKTIAGEDPRLATFQRLTGIKTEDLLEEGGFLAKRSFTKGKEYKLGDKTLTIEEGTIEELNRKLAEIFPEFEGKIYETNPFSAWERYIQATTKDIANEGALRRQAKRGATGAFINREGKPQNYDPYSGRETIGTSVDKEGFETPIKRVVPNPSEKPTSEFYEMVPDKKATKARDEAVRKSNQGDIAKKWEGESLDERKRIAAGLDELAEEVYAPIRSARKAEEPVQAGLTKAIRGQLDENRELLARRDTAVEKVAQIDDILEGLQRQIDEVEAPLDAEKLAKRFKSRMRVLRSERKKAQAEVDKLTARYERSKASIEGTREVSERMQQRARDSSREQVESHTKELRNAADDKYREYVSVRDQARQDAKGVMTDEQRRADTALIKETGAMPAGNRQHAALNTRRAAQREVVDLQKKKFELVDQKDDLFESVMDGTLTGQAADDALEQVRVLERNVELLEGDITQANSRIRAASAETKLTEAEQAWNRLSLDWKARNRVDKGAPAAARLRALKARADLTEWQTALRSFRNPPAQVDDTAFRAAQQLLATPENREIARRITALENFADADPAVLERLQDDVAAAGEKLATAKTARSQATARKRLDAARGQLRKGEEWAAERAKTKKDLELYLSRRKAKVAKVREAMAVTPPKAAEQLPPVAIPPKMEEITKEFGQRMEMADPAKRLERAAQTYEPQIAQQQGRAGQLEGRIAEPDAEMSRMQQELEEAAKTRAAPIRQEAEKYVGQRAEQTGQTEEIAEALEVVQGGYSKNLQDLEASRVRQETVKEQLKDYKKPSSATAKVGTNKKAGQAAKTRLEKVSTGAIAAEDAQPLVNVVEEIDKLIVANPTGADALMNRAEAVNAAFRDDLAKLTTTKDLPALETRKIEQAAKKGDLPPVLTAQLKTGFRQLREGSDIIIDAELDRMLNNVVSGIESKAFGKVFTLYTNFFKTYATLSPGFHIRNALSAIFMNSSEGVRMSTQARGVQIWREFAASDEPIEWMARQTPEVRKAFEAVFASGSGGQFFEKGVSELTTGSTRLKEGLFANRLTKGSQRIGQDWVEGPMRLALALHTTSKGGSVERALERVTRIHFDYSQASRFDEKMKRYVPFWTFMSRNVPLQFTQMWSKPKLYAWYASWARNMGQVPDPMTPQYIAQGGGIDTGIKTPDWLPFAGEDMPLWLTPDLPHSRLEDDMQRFANAASGENMGQVLTNFNPALTAPLEFALGQDFFTGKTYEKTDFSKVGPADLPLLPIAAAMGQVKMGAEGPMISDKMRETGRALIPLYDRSARMVPKSIGKENDDRTFESWARFLGMPIRTISDAQKLSEAKRQARVQRDQASMSAMLQRTG